MDKMAATMEPERAPAGAAKIGMEMRQVRERLGWRLADIAAELRIRLPYLEAIERGELSALPGAAYQTGFVRTYSQALGLDGDEILRRFRAEGTSFVAKAELSFLAPVPDRAVPTGALVLLGVVLVVVGYGLWYRHTAQEAQLAAQIPTIPTELAPLAIPPKPPAPAAAAKPAPASQTVAANAASTLATPAPAPAPATPAPPASAQTPAASALPPPPPPAPTAGAAAPAPAPAAPSAGEKVIEATGDSWVQVQDSKGNILFSKTLHAGDSWPVPDMAGLILTAGNAGNTLIADGAAPGLPLGGAGVVVRKYTLTAPAAGAGETPLQAAPAARPQAAGPIHTASAPKPSAPVGTGGVQGPSPGGPSPGGPSPGGPTSTN